MSDMMRPISFSHLMNWILTEHRDHGTVFGVQFSKMPRHTDGQALPLFAEKIESPYGPAAGPNTQLAQNIIASYVAGARFFELKTVQIMDGEELSKCVSKPCITAEDECYNCEWSTELTVPQAYAEYVKAWFVCKLLAKEFGLGDPDGFIFNMSVGYDLKGIQSAKIDAYIEGMKDASHSEIWAKCMEWTLTHLDRFQHVDAAYVNGITSIVSRSITESTLHGCPPDEIERIATYLIKEKGLNTYVKCNPTLLGYDFARKTLDSLGFDYIVFDDHHFVEDLQMADALPMFHRLQALCAERGLEFGVKLTNTFPVDVAAGELPSQEMYMSGRSLYPLTLSLAGMLTREFGGKLRISYSGGADAYNIKDLFDAGIWPITMATTVLKPGGYERFCQIGRILSGCGSQPWTGVNGAKVDALVDAIFSDPRLRKPMKPIPGKKLIEKVPLLDCFTAPCHEQCPIHQDIPAYLKLAGKGKYQEALEVITQRNALPFITGTICPHHCTDKCMRGNYDESIYIREVKLEAAQKGFAALLPTLQPKAAVPGKKVAVVGGGPAGLAAAYYLAREGVSVTVFERRDSLGGIVRHVIPEFRIPAAYIDFDVALVKAMGAEIKLNTEVNSAGELKAQGYTHVIFATGAWEHGELKLEHGHTANVLEFLLAAKADISKVSLGKNVVVVGGGNTAMDAARVAKRVPGVENVYLVYRRDQRNMPADEEELQLAEADGVYFRPLLAPISHENGQLLCHKMMLGERDASGRRSPVDTGEMDAIPADTVIAAVGERVDSAFFLANGVVLDDKGRVTVSAVTSESQNPGVYVVGDAHTGPNTVVEAMADAMKAAQAIAELSVEKFDSANTDFDKAVLHAKRGELCVDRSSCTEGDRCLGCAAVCETCASVCPNRANIAVVVPGMASAQIIHVDGMCNECGNCATFCPYDSRPYKDKFTLFWSEEDFENSENEGFLPAGDGSGRCKVRLGGQVKDYDVSHPCGLYEPLRQLILAVRNSYGYLIG
ncbi:MAG: putative selenate reductase subunit YgfK [Pseudoflavonifractor sp.]|nr:putative selenate reductase subunit YgfK [Pseudoflavonifractor sp.]